MKVAEILLEFDRLGAQFSHEELDLVYQTVVDHHEEFDMNDLKGLAQQLSEKEEWRRNAGSAKFALARMHVLLHGVAPHGATEKTAENWMMPSGIMDAYARQRGIDVSASVSRARRELKGRKPKIKEVDARKQMAAYAQENRHAVTDAHRQNRDKIVADIQAGLTPEEAFNRFSRVAA